MQVPLRENQHATSFMIKISFVMRKINLKVSREKNQLEKSFRNKNQDVASYIKKVKMQRVPGTESVSRRKKSINKFHEMKNQSAKSVTINNQNATSSMKQNSAGKKLQENKSVSRSEK